MNTQALQTLDLRCINTLRTLAIDQVQNANSGHPGTPMGAAPTAYCLWQRFLRFDRLPPASLCYRLTGQGPRCLGRVRNRLHVTEGCLGIGERSVAWPRCSQ